MTRRFLSRFLRDESGATAIEYGLIAALIAAVLPNPRRWSPAAPTNYIKRRTQWVMGRMGGVAVPLMVGGDDGVLTPADGSGSLSLALPAMYFVFQKG